MSLNYADKAEVAPGGYTEVVTMSIAHPLMANNEPLSLNGSTAGSGITISFLPASPVQVPAGKELNVTIDLTASNSATIGNDNISIQAGSGATAQKASFTLRVVQYRVVMVHSTFNPMVMNVTVGSTVYWQNLDGPAAGCGASTVGTGAHSVVFTTIPGVNSSKVPQFGFFNYTFTTAGSYFYYSSLDSDHSMNGTINVMAAGGGMGMVSKMPSFSYFKGGSTFIHPQARANSLGPVSTFAAMGLVIAALSALSFGALLLASPLGLGRTLSSGLVRRIGVTDNELTWRRHGLVVHGSPDPRPAPKVRKILR